MSDEEEVLDFDDHFTVDGGVAESLDLLCEGGNSSDEDDDDQDKVGVEEMSFKAIENPHVTDVENIEGIEGIEGSTVTPIVEDVGELEKEAVEEMNCDKIRAVDKAKTGFSGISENFSGQRRLKSKATTKLGNHGRQHIFKLWLAVLFYILFSCSIVSVSSFDTTHLNTTVYSEYDMFTHDIFHLSVNIMNVTHNPIVYRSAYPSCVYSYHHDTKRDWAQG